MKGILTVLIVILAGPSPTLGQVNRSSEIWRGTWILDMAKSGFGAILFPGTPPDLKILGQELRIDIAESKMRLSGETALKIAGKTLTSKDDTSLSLDGTENRVGPAVLALRSIDTYTFEIVSTLKQTQREYREISRFVFSRDGATFTETKVQTERAIAGDTALNLGDKALRSSTSTLVFSRKP